MTDPMQDPDRPQHATFAELEPPDMLSIEAAIDYLRMIPFEDRAFAFMAAAELSREQVDSIVLFSTRLQKFRTVE